MRQNVSRLTLAVLGSTGGTGRHVVSRALQNGHDVVALVRRPDSFDPTSGLREVVVPDVSDVGAVTEAIRGVDVVISALGGTGTGTTTVCTDTVRALIPAMNSIAVARLIVVSAHGVLETRDGSLYSRAVWLGVGEKMKDKETMEPLLVASDLDWTIVRPPMLKDTPATGTYVTGDDLPIRLWHAISRADLADFLVLEAEESRYVRRYPRLHR
jgi:putative NADH-flavin reductase